LLASEYWTSLYDVVYVMREDREWVQDRSIEKLRGRPFIAIIHERFTDKTSHFYRKVTTLCAPEPPRLDIHHLYVCDDSFVTSQR